jgi:signal peptidase II
MSDARSASPNSRVFWGAAVIVVVLDVITKRLAERYLTELLPHRVIGDVVRLTLVHNPGAAFSMSLGGLSRYIFGLFALVALVILWRLYRQSSSRDIARVLALGLAWGGAAGNLLDRVRSGRGVVDFIDIGVRSIRFWTFNVADSAVTIGALILAWVLWHEDRESERRKKQLPSDATRARSESVAPAKVEEKRRA